MVLFFIFFRPYDYMKCETPIFLDGNVTAKQKLGYGCSKVRNWPLTYWLLGKMTLASNFEIHFLSVDWECVCMCVCVWGGGGGGGGWCWLGARGIATAELMEDSRSAFVTSLWLISGSSSPLRHRDTGDDVVMWFLEYISSHYSLTSLMDLCNLKNKRY